MSALRVAIVGAGVSGIGMAIKLQRAGIPFTIFEKADEVGGTWRDNTYPGLVCDVPAAVYTYSFARSPELPRMLANGGQLQEYVRRVCDEHGLREHIRFGTEVADARWSDSQWTLRTADGERHEFDALVHATGFLHRPRVPELPGLETFAGPAFHSARWDHDAETAGRRVGVIGTGSSGVQIVTALAGTASHVALFQRTAQWIFPAGNARVPDVWRRALVRWPALAELWVRFLVRAFGDHFLGPAAIRPGLQRRLFGWICRRHLNTIRDPELRARLTPTYRPLCKRPVASDGFYEAMQRPDVSLVDAGIERIVPEGVMTLDGKLHELDVLVLATGFDAHAYMRPMDVTGVDGATLAQAWRNGPRAYRTVALPSFPNMFLLLGPHSPLINVPIHESVELQADYVIQALALIARDDVESISPSAEAEQRWMDDLRAGMAPTVWANGCNSWYIGPDGLAVQWPFSRQHLRKVLKAPDFGDFEIRAASARGIPTRVPSP